MNIQGIIATQFENCSITVLGLEPFTGSTPYGPISHIKYTGTLPVFADVEAAEPAFLALANDRVAASNRLAAQTLRDDFIESNIELFAVDWQIETESRDKMNAAIDYATRNDKLAETRYWILADNTPRESTIADLEAVLDAYTLRMDNVFMQYGVWAGGDMLTPFEIVVA